MSYIGNTDTQQAFTPAVDFFNGNGSTTAFTLSRPVASVAQVQAVISNVPQKPGDAFTVNGNTITFTSAPPSGTQNIYVYYTSPITQVIAPGQGTVSTSSLAASSITGSGAMALASLPSFTTTIGVGGATASASGSGVSFPATQSASSDANTLDDYEEGSWTPTYSQGVTSPVYTSTGGYYRKVGSLVFVSGRIQLTSGTANSSGLILSGLPFNCANGIGTAAAICIGYNGGFRLDGNIYCLTAANSSFVEFYKRDGSAFLGTNADSISATLHFSGCYISV